MENTIAVNGFKLDEGLLAGSTQRSGVLIETEPYEITNGIPPMMYKLTDGRIIRATGLLNRGGLAAREELTECSRCRAFGSVGYSRWDGTPYCQACGANSDQASFSIPSEFFYRVVSE